MITRAAELIAGALDPEYVVGVAESKKALQTNDRDGRISGRLVVVYMIFLWEGAMASCVDHSVVSSAPDEIACGRPIYMPTSKSWPRSQL